LIFKALADKASQAAALLQPTIRRGLMRRSVLAGYRLADYRLARRKLD
jgi:hypothetical protein